MESAFYFIPQTGVVSFTAPKAPSNYYTYCLPGRCLAKVKLAVEASTVGAGGLVYEDGFLKWVASNDLGCGNVL
jgi:hypothetical protein